MKWTFLRPGDSCICPQVKVGNLNPVVGYLGYSDSQLNLILALALGIGLGVIVIATVVLVIYCKCCRHHSKDPEAGNGKPNSKYISNVLFHIVRGLNNSYK
jgi:hypothetical protein